MDMGYQKQSIIKRMISQINDAVNNIAANQMTTSLDYDRARVVYDMKAYGYKTVGEYARAQTNIVKILVNHLFGKSY
jgi:hypothetical protein